jgi:metallophosphoesterase superfamily enzyme
VVSRMHPSVSVNRDSGLTVRDEYFINTADGNS